MWRIEPASLCSAKESSLVRTGHQAQPKCKVSRKGSGPHEYSESKK